MTDSLQQLLDLHRAGHPSAREAILVRSLDQFQKLARLRLRQNQDLRALAQTDDVVQEAVIRLHRALAQLRPATVQELFGLAGLQVRRVLGDLVRRLDKDGLVTFSDQPPEPAARAIDFLLRADVQEKIEALPPEEQEVVDLLVFQGLEQRDVANLLGISVRTIKRRWQQARLKLYRALQEESPNGR